MKNFIVLFFLLFSIQCYSVLLHGGSVTKYHDNKWQGDTILTYFDKSGSIVPSKIESYFYQRIVSIGNDSLDLFSVIAYYTTTDSVKSQGYSRRKPQFKNSVRYVGKLKNYYPEGELKSQEKFDSYSVPIDSSYYFYPNGNLKMIVIHQEDSISSFMGSVKTKPYYLVYLDSIGNYLLKRGNGFLRLDNDDGTYIEGEIKDNKRVGKWKGWNMNTSYEELYIDNVLISGKRYLENGEIVPYFKDNIEVLPSPPIEIGAYMKELYKEIVMPRDFLSNSLISTISLTFRINKDGRIDNYRIAEDIPVEVRRNIINGVQKMGKWKPGLQRGMAINVDYTIPIRIK